jgi:hypothetical protein
MSKIYKLQNVEDYIFCGLYYRFKHVLNFPYKPISANEVFVEAMKDAIFIIINQWGLKRKHPRIFIADAAEAFKEKFTKISTNCRETDKLVELYAQGLISINTVLGYIDITKDIVALFNYPIYTKCDDSFVESKIDLMVIRNDENRSKREYEFISFINDKTYKYIQNYDSIKVGLARNFIEDIDLKLEYPCNHRYMSYFGHPRIATKLSKSYLNIALQLLKNTISMIENQVYLPNSSKAKCNSCPFNKICDQKFVIKNLPDSWINSARKELNGH